MSESQNQAEKIRRLAELEAAERLAVIRWKKEIKEAEQKRIYNFLIQKRQVKYLVHFTPIDNLHSILKHGILSRDELVRRDITAKTPDEMRMDCQTEYTSFSVSFPNYQLFYKKRQITQYEYVVLLVDPKLILDVPLDSISYLPNNAASRFTGAAKQYTGEEAVKKLFDNTGLLMSICDRSELSIPVSYTTNPQAEVFIKGNISPKRIRCILTKSYTDAEKLNRESKKWIDCEHPAISWDQSFFGPRADYRFWKNQAEEDI